MWRGASGSSAGASQCAPHGALAHRQWARCERQHLSAAVGSGQMNLDTARVARVVAVRIEQQQRQRDVSARGQGTPMQGGVLLDRRRDRCRRRRHHREHFRRDEQLLCHPFMLTPEHDVKVACTGSYISELKEAVVGPSRFTGFEAARGARPAAAVANLGREP